MDTIPLAFPLNRQRRRRWGDGISVAVLLFWVLCNLVFWGVVAYAVAHFVLKFW